MPIYTDLLSNHLEISRWRSGKEGNLELVLISQTQRILFECKHICSMIAMLYKYAINIYC